MNKKNVAAVAALLLTALLTGCAGQAGSDTAGMADAAAMLTQVKTTQFFSDEAVSAEDIQTILAAGVNAPSAMNTQPWHFAAVTDKETTQKLADAMSSMKPPAAGKADSPAPPAAADGQMPQFPTAGAPGSMPAPSGDKPAFFQSAAKAGIGDAPLTIVISCQAGAELSAGLATQNMSAVAQLLGYGTKIMTAPTMGLNGENQAEYRRLLGVPEDQSFAAVLIVGRPADAGDVPDTASGATSRNDFDQVVTVIGD